MLAPVSQGTMDAERYAGVVDDGFRVPPVSLNMLNPQFRRQLAHRPSGAAVPVQEQHALPGARVILRFKTH